mgnify:CR=1 FL=1
MYESNHFAQFDLGSATQYFCLRAAELGLGTCVLGAFNEEKVKTLLQIPVERHVFVMLAVGYSSGAFSTFLLIPAGLSIIASATCFTNSGVSTTTNFHGCELQADSCRTPCICYAGSGIFVGKNPYKDP